MKNFSGQLVGVGCALHHSNILMLHQSHSILRQNQVVVGFNQLNYKLLSISIEELEQLVGRLTLENDALREERNKPSDS